jgi:hypothetical protein
MRISFRATEFDTRDESSGFAIHTGRRSDRRVLQEACSEPKQCFSDQFDAQLSSVCYLFDTSGSERQQVCCMHPACVLEHRMGWIPVCS